MNGKGYIKHLLKLRGWSQAKLAKETGTKQSNITGYLNRYDHDLRLDIFVNLCTAMGYEVVVRDKMDHDKVIGMIDTDER